MRKQGLLNDNPFNGMKLREVQPKTHNQNEIFKAFKEDKHLLLHGMAGTGKTYVSMYLALDEIQQPNTRYNKLLIMRSVVPTRDIGFLPGKEKEKIEVYEEPYRAICTELYSRGDAYEILKTKNTVRFMCTSFIRGLTIDNAIVIVDEMSNLNFHELDSLITRLGENCRVIFCGDFRQTDLVKVKEKNGLGQFMKIIDQLTDFTHVEFEQDDIVRSGLVRDYIIAREQLGYCM
jgi:phosphate starvation-inducible protein PhoH